MRKILLTFCVSLINLSAMAQVPNFGRPAGDQHLYGYNALKFRANTNTWENYTTLQYGITDYIAIGGDLYTDGNNSYMGYTVRTGVKTCNWFSIGAQFTPSFNLGDKHKFAYMTYALYMNGNITKAGKLFWVTNTWLEQNKTVLSSAKQWTYIGYSFELPGSANSITPMAGIIHSWKFDQAADLSFGAYFTHKNMSVYAWTNDILTDHPRFCVALEFKFGNKVNKSVQ